MEEFINSKIEEARSQGRDIPPVIEEMFLHMAKSMDAGKPPEEKADDKPDDEPKQLEYSGD